MCPIVRTQFFVLSFFDIIIISFCRISVYILRHFFCFDILDKNADKTKKYKDLYILHDNSRQNLTVHLPSFSSDFHMQLSKIITANIAVKWGQGSNLPVIRPDFFVTPTDYLFADFYNTQRTLCQCSIKSCYIKRTLLRVTSAPLSTADTKKRIIQTTHTPAHINVKKSLTFPIMSLIVLLVTAAASTFVR